MNNSIRHPPDYEPLSYNSRPPGGGPPIRRRSSILSPTTNNLQSPTSSSFTVIKENNINSSKPLNGYLPNGYGNNNITNTYPSETIQPTTTTTSSDFSVFPMMSQQQTQQSQIQRRQSENENQQPKQRNSFDLSPHPHDYEKEYAVYDNIQSTNSPDFAKQPNNNFSPQIPETVYEEIPETFKQLSPPQQPQQPTVTFEQQQQPPIESTEKRDYKTIWRTVYRKICKDELGYEVRFGNFF